MHNQDTHPTVFSPDISFKKLNDALTENDILFIQNSFLTNGYHYFVADDIKKSRYVVNKILTSLNYYKQNACLTMSADPLETEIFNIYQIIKKNNFDEKNLHDLFLDNRYYYDFLWIEMCKNLLAAQWFKLFQQLILDFNLYNNIPIIVIKIDKI